MVEGSNRSSCFSVFLKRCDQIATYLSSRSKTPARYRTIRQGEQLHVVAERLGHRDAMTTATIYAHVSNKQAETASVTFVNAFNNG